MSIAIISTSIPNKPPAWAQTMRRWTDYLVKDFGCGPRPWKFAWVINFQKTGTFPILAFLIAWYQTPRPPPGFIWPCMALTAWSGLLRISRFLIVAGRPGSRLQAASMPSLVC